MLMAFYTMTGLSLVHLQWMREVKMKSSNSSDGRRLEGLILLSDFPFNFERYSHQQSLLDSAIVEVSAWNTQSHYRLRMLSEFSGLF